MLFTKFTFINRVTVKHRDALRDASKKTYAYGLNESQHLYYASFPAPLQVYECESGLGIGNWNRAWVTAGRIS